MQSSTVAYTASVLGISLFLALLVAQTTSCTRVQPFPYWIEYNGSFVETLNVVVAGVPVQIICRGMLPHEAEHVLMSLDFKAQGEGLYVEKEQVTVSIVDAHKITSLAQPVQAEIKDIKRISNRDGTYTDLSFHTPGQQPLALRARVPVKVKDVTEYLELNLVPAK